MNASPTVLPRRASASYQALRLGLVVLRHLLQRPAYLAAVVVSFALVAGVCALTFSVRHGLLATVEASQEPGLFFLMNAQADSELSSIVTPAQALYLQQLPNLGGGCGPAAARAGRSPELALLTRQAPDGRIGDFMVRGVTASAFEMCNAQGGRRYATLVDGRMFKAGARELLVGAALARRYPEFAPGKSVTIHGISWAITGSFQSNGSIRESEFWTGLDTLRTDYGLGESYSVVAFTGTPQADVGAFNDALAAIEKGKLRVTDAATHYAGKGQDLVSLIGLFGVAFSALAGVVVLIGVAALAESLLVNLATELRTLRLIGFGRVLFAAFAGPFALLGIAGGLLGALACWLGTSALSFSTFSSAHEIVFRPVLTLPIAGLALLYGTVLALAAAGVNYRRIVRGA